MIAPLAKFLDWLHIERSCRRMPSIDGRVHRLEEAVRFLKSPDFISAESQPAPVQFDSEVNFRFAIPRPSAFEENNIAYGRLYRCAERWQEKPVILLLHGGGLMRGRKSSLKYRFAYPVVARACNHAGFNAATLELPHNFQRHPRPEVHIEWFWLKCSFEGKLQKGKLRGLFSSQNGKVPVLFQRNVPK